MTDPFATAAVVTTPDPFESAPPAPKGPSLPKLANLMGQLVLIRPSLYEPKVTGQYGEQAQITANVVVLTGPFMYGGDGKSIPDSVMGNPPFKIDNMWITGTRVVPQLREKVGKLVLGRVQRDGKATVLSDQITDEDKARARAYLAQNA